MPNRPSWKTILFVGLITPPILVACFIAHSIQLKNGIEEPRAHTRAELKFFINSPYRSPQNVDNYLVQDDVPTLIDMLNERWYRDEWGVIAHILARLDEGTEAQHAIIHFIQRGDTWPLGDRARDDFIWSKIHGIIALAQTNGDLARATAQGALTERGALKLAQDWIGRDLPSGQFESNPYAIVTFIRGRAAMGLVYSLDKESVDLVEDLYESVAPRVKKTT